LPGRSDNQYAAMPDRLSGLLIAGAPIVQERAANDIEAFRCADDLRSGSNAYHAAGVLVLGNWLTLVLGVLFGPMLGSRFVHTG
jgi:hypothetical protein